MRLNHWIELGFDNSRLIGKQLRVSCSQCEVLAINGTPCHETGCSHEMHLCKGCDTIIPLRQKYCADCQ